eukprot:GILI01008953.1.p1 GENE.GILI01008953.1~~GILI01008953.1.p1  ORF type:complete len:624 (+),score=189.37 GILI01008953.1:41-1873(+)
MDSQDAMQAILEKPISAEEDMGAAAWVARMRGADAEKKAKAEELARKQAEMLDALDQEAEASVSVSSKKSGKKGKKYSSRDVANLRVDHDSADIQEGETLILTLKDTSVLAGDDINDEEDTLEIISLKEKERLRKNQELKQKRKVYDATDADEFTADGVPKERSILGQYDETPETKGMRLKEMREKLQASLSYYQTSSTSSSSVNLGAPAEISLDTEKRIGNEYYTPEEMASMFKKRKKKKVSKKREKIEDMLGLGEAQDEEARPDHGSRAARRRQLDEEEEEARERIRDRVDPSRQAGRTRDDQDEEMLSVAPAPVSLVVDEEDDIELRLSLQQRLKQQQLESSRPEDRLKALLQASRRPEEEEGANLVDSAGIVFTETEEFVRHIKVEPNEESGLMTSVRVKKEEREEKVGEEDVSMLEAMHKSGITINIKHEGAEEHEEESDEDDEEENGHGLGEASLDTGISAALHLLRQRGELDKQKEIVGRSRDRRDDVEDEVIKVEAKGRTKEVHLEYRDEHGRLLTKKEAFRRMCWDFHGKKPSKRKQEKRLKQEMAEAAQKGMDPSTDLTTMKVLKSVQEKSAQPFLMVGNHHAPTVSAEKEPPSKKQKTK